MDIMIAAACNAARFPPSAELTNVAAIAVPTTPPSMSCFGGRRVGIDSLRAERQNVSVPAEGDVKEEFLKIATGILAVSTFCSQVQEKLLPRG